MFEARRTLEVSIARMAAERATAGQLAAISDSVSGMFATCDDPQAFLVVDIRFHAAVGIASGNPILASVVEMISAMFYEQRRKTADAGAIRPVADAHWHIYQAIRDREPGRAANLMSEHLIQAERDQQAEEPDGQQPRSQRDRTRRRDGGESGTCSLVAVLFLPGGWTASAFAQLTTGTIAGSVQDAQGAAIPGAAVTLTSETMGTRKEFTTDTQGNYVFPNLAPDTYTVEVVLSGFKTAKRAGVAVSPGDRVVVPALVLEVGQLQEVVQVKAEAPLMQAQVRRAFVHRRHRRGAEPADPGPVVHAAGGAGAGRHRHDAHRRPLVDRRRRHQRADGRRVDDGHRQQPRDHRPERRVDRRSESARLELSGGVRPIERPADHRRDQERHEPVPRLGLRRRAQLRLERQQPDQHPERRSEDGAASSASGAIRSAGRSASPGGNNKLFFFYTQEFEPRTGGNDVVAVPRADRARAAGRLLAVHRQQRQPVSRTSRTRRCPGRATAANRRPASPTAACSAGSRPAQLYQTGPEHPEDVADAEHHERAAGQAYNYELTRPSESILSTQPAMRFDYQPLAVAARSFKYSGFSAARADAAGLDSRLERHADGDARTCR